MDKLDRRTQRAKQGLNVDFFKNWSPEMAYVLGYFCADGCMFKNSGGSKYIAFSSIDRDLLEKIKGALYSVHKISPKRQSRPNCKSTFLLQIGSQEVYDDLLRLGIFPNKESRLKLPSIPKGYFKDFIRGYFDGDGCITSGYYARKDRKSKSFRMWIKFASSSQNFLVDIKEKLAQYASLKEGFITAGDGCKYLVYSKDDSNKIFKYLYYKINSDIYLERKYTTFLKIFPH